LHFSWNNGQKYVTVTMLLELYPFQLADTDGGESGSTLTSQSVKKYVRRRYTDTRHPTKELPDVRLDVPESLTVKNPPTKKT
jgi:hypothetical protein